MGKADQKQIVEIQSENQINFDGKLGWPSWGKGLQDENWQLAEETKHRQHHQRVVEGDSKHFEDQWTQQKATVQVDKKEEIRSDSQLRVKIHRVDQGDQKFRLNPPKKIKHPMDRQNPHRFLSLRCVTSRVHSLILSGLS